MANQPLKIGIVGASSLLGKELSEELGRGAFAAADVTLFDETEAEGQLATAGDELTFLRKIEEATFEQLDFVFFAGTREQTLEYWQLAKSRGATVIDLSQALRDEAGAITWSPSLRGVDRGAAAPDLQTTVVVPAFGPSMMLALVADRLRVAKLAPKTFVATLLLPASEFGKAAMDELHQQTVGLLSFQPLPHEVFDVQSAFNLLGAFGAEAKVSLGEARRSVLEQYGRLRAPEWPELALQLVQAPVFHGYAISLFVELEAGASVAELERALAGDRVEVAVAGATRPVRTTKVKDGEDDELEDEVAESDGTPSNLTAAGQDDILVRVTADGTEASGRRFWVWMAADNLRLATSAAVEAALYMRQLRPQGTVQ